MGEQTLGGKAAVITGGARGIGLAIARAFTGAGARCAIIVRNAANGEAAAKTISAEGVAPIVAIADVTNESAVARAAGQIAQRLGVVHVLVNNAGILLDEDRATPPSRMILKALRDTLEVNLFGAVIVTRALVPHMAYDGRIINVSSTLGQLTGGSDGYAPAYSISKAALNELTILLAGELKPRGMMVDAFHPGWAKTAMGGPNATVDPMDAANVALFLATRQHTDKTGLFWRYNGVIDW